MSVLNKMLRDLERRQPNSTSAAAYHAPGLIIAEHKQRGWIIMLVLLGMVFLGAAVYSLLSRSAQTVAEQTLPVSAAILPVSAPARPVSEIVGAAIVLSSAVQTANENNATDSVAEPSQAIKIRPSTDSTTNAEISQRFANQSNPVPIDTAVAVATITAPSSIAAVKPVRVERAVLTPEQRAAALAQQAVSAEQRNESQQALQLWQQVQALTPSDAAPYLAQARLWLQLGQAPQAEQVLQHALAQRIIDADIQLLLAQQAAAQQQWQQVNALLPEQFALAHQPDYYGLKATALQQLGEQQAALGWFSQLIVLQPEQARWWLGAAIAHDALLRRDQAYLHYQQALQRGDSLSVASRNYIQQRLTAIE